MLRHLNPGEFVQGTIFTCCISDSYPAVPALGLLITARCDTAQGKTDVYNYVPVITVEAWLERDGLELVAKRSQASELGVMKKALTSAGMVHSILDLLDHDSILAELQTGDSKQEKGIAQRFSTALRAYQAAATVLENNNRTLQEALAFLESNDGLYRTLIKDLMTNGLAEFHYLEKSELDEETRGYVALMREIRFLSADLGKRIAVGLDAAEFEAMGEIFSPELNHIRFSAEQDFALPLSCVASPFIEFIMQRFANLFSRIGVEDIPKDRIADAHSWVKDMQGAAQ
jgi:hypothetical protein